MSTLTHAINELSFQELTTEIKRTMRRSAKDAVQLGYMLKLVAEKKLWEGYYSCLDDYLRQELRIDYSLATRFIKINQVYGDPVVGMEIKPEYENYTQGALIEMLNMPEEQREQVTPDMTVKQIRQIKQAEKEIATSQKKKAEEYCAAYKFQQNCTGCFYENREDCPYDRSGCAEAETKVAEDSDYREIPEPAAGAATVPATEEMLSPYGLAQSVYPDDSLLKTEGCGNKYYCFCCAADCSIRQADRYCVEAPMGHPFPCVSMNVIDMIRTDIGDCCQFINQELAYHTKGSGEASPCCKRCNNADCGYRCSRAALDQVTQEEKSIENQHKPEFTDEEALLEAVIEEILNDPEYECMEHTIERVKELFIYQYGSSYINVVQDGRLYYIDVMDDERNCLCVMINEGTERIPRLISKPIYHWDIDEFCDQVLKYLANKTEYTDSNSDWVSNQEITPRSVLEEEKEHLNRMLNAQKAIPAKFREEIIEKTKIMVGALAAMVCDLEMPDPLPDPEPVQPDMPVLKNNDQRKAWLEDYKTWGLWYRDENIDVNYYKYDFSDGSRLIAAEYPQREQHWNTDARDEHYYHLLEKNKEKYGGKKKYDEKYCHSTNSETYLVEFLKNLQKQQGGRKDERNGD